VGPLHITRGLKYNELETNKLWWNGPNDLKSGIKIENILNTVISENNNDPYSTLLASRSSFAKVVRIAAIIFRLRNKKPEKYLSAEEIEYARNRQLLLAQQGASFTKKRYKNFNTIIENGLIKIATRIENSCAPTETIKPILLHHKDIICQRILTDIHKKTLHGGPSRLVYEYCQEFFTPAV
jgi:hypothetical protein